MVSLVCSGNKLLLHDAYPCFLAYLYFLLTFLRDDVVQLGARKGWAGPPHRLYITSGIKPNLKWCFYDFRVWSKRCISFLRPQVGIVEIRQQSQIPVFTSVTTSRRPWSCRCIGFGPLVTMYGLLSGRTRRSDRSKTSPCWKPPGLLARAASEISVIG